MFVPARVTDVLTDDARAEPWSEGLRLGAQTLEVELLRGPTGAQCWRRSTI